MFKCVDEDFVVSKKDPTDRSVGVGLFFSERLRSNVIKTGSESFRGLCGHGFTDLSVT